MCTATTYRNRYFGRNLDYDFSYGEEIVIIPRNFPFHFREVAPITKHHAIIGIAYVANNYPLLYDAVNEAGLGMAGLNFVGNAAYNDTVADKDNVAQFEFIPWLLSQCTSVTEARQLLSRINLRNLAFATDLPPAELHWMLADQHESIVIEATRAGLQVYDNPIGVLTNNPPFPEQLFQLNNYQHLSPKDPVNTFAPELKLTTYSRGMGAIGLPGDLSSQSRFVKAAFTKLNSLSPDDELHNVSQFFHILHSVDQARGSTDLGDNKYEITIYSDCYNLQDGTLYYTSYDNHQISAVRLANADLETDQLIRYPFLAAEQIQYQN